MNNIIRISLVVLMPIYSTIAFSADPPSAPVNYDLGPQSPLVANTDLSDAERAAYVLYEGIMQIAEAKIHATSCTSAISTSTITAFADGSQLNRPYNFVQVISLGGALLLDASLRAPEPFRGQKIDVDQIGAFGILAGTLVSGYTGVVTYNEPNNMLYGSARVDVVGINGIADRYQSRVIKDFNRGAMASGYGQGFQTEIDKDYYTIFDWGLQSLHKLSYPVNKYWQRSKSRRDDGTIGRTVFVKDRLVGSSACRITIDTVGSNNEDFFSQTGTLVIEKVTPSAAVTAFAEYPF